MKNIIFLFVGLVAILSGCDPSTPDASPDAIGGRLIITGSSTIAPLAAELAQQFEQQHPGVRIDVQTGGSSRGIRDARSGLADIGMVSRALKPAEQDLQAHLIARDGIGMIVHRDNPLQQLSEPDIIAIYRGEIKNWKTLGGKDQEITVVHKAAGRSTQELFLSHFQLSPGQIRAHAIIGDNEQGIKLVAGNPGAIAYVSIGTAEYDMTQNVPIKLLHMDQVPASSENVANGRFPLTRDLTLATKTTSRLSQAFIDYATSEQAASTIRRYSFVNL